MKEVPLISGGIAGPLGIIHLPRMWLKLLLHARGMLADGYRHGVGGSDEDVIMTFGLDGPGLIAFVENERPSYLDVEAWVRENGSNLGAEEIKAFGDRLKAFSFNEQRRLEWQARFGVEDAYTTAILLNQLDDWSGAFERIDEIVAPVEPLISSRSSGPLGAKHFPRLWWTQSLASRGKLLEATDTNATDFDAECLVALGVDASAFRDFISIAKPSYLESEGWIRANSSAASLGHAAIEAFNARVESNANDLDDWNRAHQRLK